MHYTVALTLTMLSSGVGYKVDATAEYVLMKSKI